MPFNPGIVDQRGQLYSEGLQNFAQAFGSAVKEQERKRKEKAAVDFAAEALQKAAQTNPMVEQVFGITKDTDPASIKKAVVAIGGDNLAAGAQSTISMLQNIVAAEKAERARQYDSESLRLGLLALGAGQNPFSALGERNISPAVADTLSKVGLRAAQAKKAAAEAADIGTPKPPELTTDQKNARAVVDHELASGKLPNNPTAISARMAELIAGPDKQPTQEEKAVMASVEAFVAANNRQPNAAEMSSIRDAYRIPVTLDPGWERDPADPRRVRPIPGSPQEAKIRKEMETFAGSLMSAASGQKIVTEAIKGVLPKIDTFTSAWGGTLGKYLPGSPAADVAAVLTTIKARIGLDTLGELRKNAPSGASGLGQLSQLELQALQASIANLEQNQSPQQLKANLNLVLKHYNNYLARERKLAASIGLTIPDEVEPLNVDGFIVTPY